MGHYLSRIGLLAYFSLVLMALFLLTGSLKNLWTHSQQIEANTDAFIAGLKTQYPQIMDDFTIEDFNSIEPAAE